MSRELGVSSYEGDITEEATEPLLIELAQDSRGMGWVRHLCGGWHGASLDGEGQRSVSKVWRSEWGSLKSGELGASQKVGDTSGRLANFWTQS